jgi:hypothetical protein
VSPVIDKQEKLEVLDDYHVRIPEKKMLGGAMSKKEDRKKRNEELIAAMRRGENLVHINLKESWFPVRPKIEKDKKVLEFLRRTGNRIRVIKDG